MPSDSLQAAEQTQPIFRALADPSRRAILMMLKEGELRVGDIAENFDMSRPAVTKHLRILEDAGLIGVRAEGRNRFNHLNPETLRTVADWLSYFDRFWDERLSQLKQLVENNE